jgi:ketosteroid isomerase-like protein
MSEENVELIRRLYRAMDARDVEAAAELADPELEWIPDARVGEGPIRGRERVIRFLEDRAAMFGEIRTEIERLWHNGDRVLAFIRVGGEGTSNGAGFDVRIAHLWTIRDGRVVRGEGFGDRDEALEAAGPLEPESTLFQKGQRRAAELAATSTLSPKGAEELIREQERAETRKT